MNYDTSEILKLKNQLCFPLYAAARRVTSAYTPVLKPLGLTYTQYITMLVLWEEDGQSVSAICDKLMLDSGTVTPLLKKLEAEGLVTRCRCKDDERCVCIKLTEAGSALRQKAQDVPAQLGQCLALSQDEAAQLYQLLYKLLNN